MEWPIPGAPGVALRVEVHDGKTRAGHASHGGFEGCPVSPPYGPNLGNDGCRPLPRMGGRIPRPDTLHMTIVLAEVVTPFCRVNWNVLGLVHFLLQRNI